MAHADKPTVLRILDANLNRLREALRVIEETLRFGTSDAEGAGRFKLIRHGLDDIEREIGRQQLVWARDTATDPFAAGTRPEEMRRESTADILAANFKRAQEAARVIEEYGKIGDYIQASEKAKLARFELYALEKRLVEKHSDG